MEGIEEPVDRAMLAVLRRAVLDLAVTERRRSFPALLHVGLPGGAEQVFPADPTDPGDPLDHALRADVVAALLHRFRRAGAVPLVWLTRPGELVVQDVDAAWLAGARQAAAEAGIRLTMVVVTRRGWVDPRSGTHRAWKRLRQR